MSDRRQSSVSIKKVKMYNVPMLLRIRERCVVNNKTVFKKGQYVTVLRRKELSIVTGMDSYGKRFHLGEGVQNDIAANVVKEEFYPKKEEEVVDFISTGKLNNIIVKIKFDYSTWVFEPGEPLSIEDHLTAVSLGTSNERFVSLRRDLDGEMICLPAALLLKHNTFSLVRFDTQQKPDLRTLIEKKVYFTSLLPHESSLFSLPRGIVRVMSCSKIEVVLTVSMPLSSKYLLYETFPVDKRITVDVIDDKLPPKLVQDLGGSETHEYIEKLKEIDFLIHVDCYSPRFYGFVVEENIYCGDDKDLAMVELKDAPECPHPLADTPDDNKQLLLERFKRVLFTKKKTKEVEVKNENNNEEEHRLEDIIQCQNVKEVGKGINDDTSSNICSENTYIATDDIRLYNKFNAPLRDRPLPPRPETDPTPIQEHEYESIKVEGDYVSMHPSGYICPMKPQPDAQKNTGVYIMEKIIDTPNISDAELYIPAIYQRTEHAENVNDRNIENASRSDRRTYKTFKTYKTYIDTERTEYSNKETGHSNYSNNNSENKNGNSTDILMQKRRMLDYLYNDSLDDERLTSIDITSMYTDQPVPEPVPDTNTQALRALSMTKEGVYRRGSIPRLYSTNADENRAPSEDLKQRIHSDSCDPNIGIEDHVRKAKPKPPPRNINKPTPKPRKRANTVDTSLM